MFRDDLDITGVQLSIQLDFDVSLASEGFLVLLFPGFVPDISHTPFPLSLADSKQYFHILKWFLFDTFQSGSSLWGLKSRLSDSTHTFVTEQEVQVTMSANYAWRKALFQH